MLQVDGWVVFNFIVQVLCGEDIIIYGDGSQICSFCYVDDLIEGFVCLMVSLADFIGFVNIGNLNEFIICQFVELIVEMVGLGLKVVYYLLLQDDLC